MRMTFLKAHKLLGQMIEQSHGREKLCIDKRTFTNPLEADGTACSHTGAVLMGGGNL